MLNYALIKEVAMRIWEECENFIFYTIQIGKNVNRLIEGESFFFLNVSGAIFPTLGVILPCITHSFNINRFSAHSFSFQPNFSQK